MGRLLNRTVNAVQWTALSAVLRGTFQFVQLVVLARLLSPADFGLAVTTVAVISIGSLFADFGLSSAYVQAKDTNNDERSAIYLLNLLAALFVGLVLFSLAPLIARFVGNSGIVPLVHLYSPIYLINAIGLQLRLDAEKRLDFRGVVIVEVFASATGVGVAIFSALIDCGAYSYVYGSIVAATLSTALLWLFLSGGWRPNFSASLAKARRFGSFGISVIASGLISQLATNLDLLLGAKLLGVNQFGYYSGPRNFFFQILSLINPIITRIGFPLVAQVQNNRDRVAEVYLYKIEVIVGLSSIIYIFAALYSDSLVFVIFGDGWSPSVSTFRVLAIWALLRSVLNPLGNLLMGMGRPTLALKWNLVQLAIALLALSYIDVGVSDALALIMCVLIFAQIIPSWYFIIWPLCGLPLSDYLISLFRPCVMALLAVLSSRMILCEENSSLMQLVFGFLISGAIYVFISFFFRERWVKLLAKALSPSFRM